MKDKIYLLGSNGFIGSNLKRYFLNQEYDLDCPTRDELDLLNPMNYLIQDSHIIYAAGIPRSKNNDQQSYEENIKMIESILSISRNIKSFTFLSSIEVYGNKFLKELTEESPIDPLNLYAKGKIFLENKIISHFDDSVPVNILRLPGVYGASSELGLLGAIKRSIREKSTLQILNEGKDLRDFLFVEDLGSIIKKLILKEKSHTLNLASGESTSILKTCEMIKSIDRNFNYNLSSNRMDNFDIKFDISKLREEVKNLKLTSLSKGIKKSF